MRENRDQLNKVTIHKVDVLSKLLLVLNGQWLPPHRNVDECSVRCVELAGNTLKLIGAFPGRSSTITITRMSRIDVRALLAIFLIAQAHGIMFYLEPNTHKCLKEEVQADVLVSGEYEVSEAMGQKTDYVVSRLRFIYHRVYAFSFILLSKLSCRSEG